MNRKSGKVIMEFIKFFFPVFIISFLFSCAPSPKPEPGNEIFKTTLASQEYMGGGPFRAIEMDSTLVLKYFGGRNSDPTGFYYGKIEQQKWDSIKVKLEELGKIILDTANKRIVDDRLIEIYIHSHEGIKHIAAPQSVLPKKFIIEFDSILNIYKYIGLSKTNDSLRFETKIQEYNPPLQQKIEFHPPRIKG